MARAWMPVPRHGGQGSGWRPPGPASDEAEGPGGGWYVPPHVHATELLAVLAAAALGAALLERLRLPAVVGFLLAGAVLGPGGFGLVEDPESVFRIAEFGVALLLFEIGLELPLEELRRSLRTALLAGVLQVAVSVLGVALVGTLLGLPAAQATVLGMLVALSSTALVMRLLGQRGEVDTPHGRIALGILLLQDLCIVPFLLAIPLLAGSAGSHPGDLALAVAAAVGQAALLFAGARFVLPFVLDRVARLRSRDLFGLVALLVALGMAELSHLLGLGLAVGAFIAGLVLSASPYAAQLFAEVAPLRGVLLGIFFTSVGMLLDLGAAVALAPLVVVYVTGVVVLKSLVVIAIVAWVFQRTLRTAILAGLALGQTGEFSFVIAAAASQAGLVDPELEQVFVAGSILTLVASPFLIRASPWIADRLARGGGASGTPAPELRDHAVVAGYGLAGRTLAGVFAVSGIPYRVVDANPSSVERARAVGDPVTFGDVTRPAVQELLGVPRARVFCIAINDPVATRSAIEVARRLAPEVPILARTHYARDLDDLYAHGATEVVAEELEATIDLVSKALRRFDLPAAAVAHFADQMRDEGYELLRGPLGFRLDPWVADLLEEVASEWVEVPAEGPSGRSLAELAIRERTGASVLAIRRAGETTSNPPASAILEPGDSLLVLGTAEQIASLRALLARGGEDSGEVTLLA